MRTVRTKLPKVLAPKGLKKGAERGKTVMIVRAVNVVGHYIPPAFIIPRKNIRHEFLDEIHSIYNRQVYGRGVRLTVPPVATLMWSMIAPPKDDVSYEPNHFSLMVPRSDVPPASISVSDDEPTVSLDKNTLVNVETDHAADSDTDDDDVNSTTSADSDIETDDDGDDNHQDEDEDADSVNDGQIELAVGIARLPDDDWLATKHLVQLLQQPPPEIRHQTVPKSRKDNSY